MLLVSLVHDSPPFVLVIAPVFQLVGWFYLVVWKRMTGNQETYRAAFRFLLAAPFFALICLGILTIFSMLSCFIP
jgi:hypothetical protein